ncbi:MAG: 50S ribosomal protein L19 [bacterium]
MRVKEIEEFEKKQMKKEVPEFSVGDTVKVYHRIKEGDKERTQVYQGTVIRFQNAGINRTFTVRKVSLGVGVEKTYPVHSPYVEKVKVLRKGGVRRAKLYYLRELGGKSARVKQKKETGGQKV